jgi:hypothetical protein
MGSVFLWEIMMKKMLYTAAAAISLCGVYEVSDGMLPLIDASNLSDISRSLDTLAQLIESRQKSGPLGVSEEERRRASELLTLLRECHVKQLPSPKKKSKSASPEGLDSSSDDDEDSSDDEVSSSLESYGSAYVGSDSPPSTRPALPPVENFPITVLQGLKFEKFKEEIDKSVEIAYSWLYPQTKETEDTSTPETKKAVMPTIEDKQKPVLGVLFGGLLSYEKNQSVKEQMKRNGVKQDSKPYFDALEVLDVSQPSVDALAYLYFLLTTRLFVCVNDPERYIFGDLKDFVQKVRELREASLQLELWQEFNSVCRKFGDV